MRHRVAGRKLNRSSQHRVALRRNLVSSLFEHGTISTTIQKAKEVKPMAEKLITLAKKGDLASRRRVIQLLGNRAIYTLEEGGESSRAVPSWASSSATLGPRYLDRPGGYTRIIKMPLRRLGDNGELVLLQLVGKDDQRQSKGKTRKKVQAADIPAAAPVAEPVEEEVVEEAVAEEAPAEEPQTDRSRRDRRRPDQRLKKGGWLGVM